MFLKMGRWVTRSYLVEMVNQAYLNQERNCYFCFTHYEEELRDKKFNNKNSHVKNWFVIYF